MSILLIGDPHFKTNNIPECNLFKKEVETYLSTSQLKAIVIMGDVLDNHEKIYTSALNSAMEFINMCTSFFHTYILVGNHDAVSNTIFLEESHWMNALKGKPNITIVDKPYLLEENNKKILLCPYVPDGRFVEALSHFPNWNTVDLILAHQLLDGAKMGPIIASGVETWESDYPMCISGHIHDKQRVKPNLYYLGSSMQHAFGESGDKSLCLYDVDSGDWQDIFLGGIKKKEILYVDVNDLDTIEDKLKDNKEYKIVIKGEAADIKAAKNSNFVKKLKEKGSIKSVQVKETFQSVDLPKNIKEENSFIDYLTQIVDGRKDPVIKSFIDSLLGFGEDKSIE